MLTFLAIGTAFAVFFAGVGVGMHEELTDAEQASPFVFLFVGLVMLWGLVFLINAEAA